MNFPHTVRSVSPQQTQELGCTMARLVLENQTSGKPIICCLYGELGSGKTTFTQGFAKALGLSERILSPTFLVIRSYDLASEKRLHHIDLYRMQSSHDIESVGIAELFSQPNAIILIEWPEKILDHIPKERWDITFNAEDETSRTITIQQLLSSRRRPGSMVGV